MIKVPIEFANLYKNLLLKHKSLEKILKSRLEKQSKLELENIALRKSNNEYIKNEMAIIFNHFLPFVSPESELLLIRQL